MILPDGTHDVPAGKIAAVVTSLEMRQRPPVPAVPKHVPWQLRRAGPPVDPSRYRKLFSAVGEPWLWFSRLRMADDRLRAILDDPMVEVYVLTDAAGREIGLLELDFRQREACELAFFGLVPDAIGAGAGRFMMSQAVERAWSQPLSRFWVHTCTLDHPGALDFYLRSGFRVISRQVEIADDPRLVGILQPSAAPRIPIV